MGENSDDDSLFWIEPEERGIFPLESFHISKSLRKTVRQEKFEVRINYNFEAIIDGCASPKPGRISTWINKPIRRLYKQLFDQGNCHTVETWIDDKLVGGLYGVHIAGAFFGESMFSNESDASKVALVHLVARLKHGGFSLLDTQFLTDHLQSMGAVEISKKKYRARLQKALFIKGDFLEPPVPLPVHKVLQLVSHTSNAGCSTP